MNLLKKMIIPCIFFLTACSNDLPQTPPTNKEEPIAKVYVIPGDYYSMLLGLDGDKLTGVYRDKAEGENPCFFFFEGTVGTTNPLKMTCYNPLTTLAPTKGNFKIMGSDMLVKINQSIAPTCNPEFADNTGHALLLDLQHKDWLAIRIIEKNGSSIYQTNNRESELGDKLSKGTIVAVKEYRKDWLRVAIPNGNYKKDGWIHQSILFPLVEL